MSSTEQRQLSEAALDAALQALKASRRDRLARDTHIPRWRWALAAAIPLFIAGMGIKALVSGDQDAARINLLIALVSLIVGFAALKSKQAAARRLLNAEYPPQRKR